MIWKKGPDRPLADLSLRELVRTYRGIDQGYDGPDGPDGRVERLDALAAEVLRRTPDDANFWFDRAMYAKWRRDWTASRELGLHGLDLVPDDRREGEPLAWNLGIAATALRDWRTARLAWSAFGIHLDGDDDAPISADFGLCPVRLNPDPRFVGESELVVDGEHWDTEVVWGLRLDPARIQVQNVPLPTSGHRFGDVVLHDGDPNGSRRLDGEEVPVFDEILLWERSPVPTCSVAVGAPGEDDLGELLAGPRRGGTHGRGLDHQRPHALRRLLLGQPGATRPPRRDRHGSRTNRRHLRRTRAHHPCAAELAIAGRRPVLRRGRGRARLRWPDISHGLRTGRRPATVRDVRPPRVGGRGQLTETRSTTKTRVAPPGMGPWPFGP